MESRLSNQRSYPKLWPTLTPWLVIFSCKNVFRLGWANEESIRRPNDYADVNKIDKAKNIIIRRRIIVICRKTFFSATRLLILSLGLDRHIFNINIEFVWNYININNQQTCSKSTRVRFYFLKRKNRTRYNIVCA